jgi:hypothetical protein
VGGIFAANASLAAPARDEGIAVDPVLADLPPGDPDLPLLAAQPARPDDPPQPIDAKPAAPAPRAFGVAFALYPGLIVAPLAIINAPAEAPGVDAPAEGPGPPVELRTARRAAAAGCQDRAELPDLEQGLDLTCNDGPEVGPPWPGWGPVLCELYGSAALILGLSAPDLTSAFRRRRARVAAPARRR